MKAVRWLAGLPWSWTSLHVRHILLNGNGYVTGLLPTCRSIERERTVSCTLSLYLYIYIYIELRLPLELFIRVAIPDN